MEIIFVIIGDHKMEKKSCPKCGSDDVATILLGFTTINEELEKKLKNGKVILGGCCVSGNDPILECNDCKFQWGKDNNG